ncbi:MAG: type IV pilus twitching motility protein PilT [Chthoniobacteraceae bacterium]|jgi:twitching motility protein PilT
MATIPLDDLLRLVIEEDASDLHLSVGVPPTLRLKGLLVPLNAPALSGADMETLARGLARPDQMDRVNDGGSVDFGFTFRDANRFRVSVYRERGNLAAAVRLLPRKLLSLETIGMPPSVRELLDYPRGLVLVTGPTGSGKTTSLASMLTVINETSPRHIITIEDPIEYYLDHRRGIVNQREVGVDVSTFAEGLRRALRQDPDVILVGEMRDLETIETAITAAETGHLVFSTLHTTGAARTIDRIVDAFDPQAQQQIRVQLSMNLKAVISQILLPRRDGTGRVAVFEVMINTSSIGALLRDNKSYRIHNEILTGSKYGMVSLEGSLIDLYRRGVITREQVLGYAQDPEVARQMLGERVAI